MNAKITVCVICVDAIIYLLLYYLHDCTDKAQKYLKHNSSPFMSRTLRKAIMTRSKLKSRYYLDRTTINFEN